MKKGFIESKEYMFQEEAEERVDNRNVSGYRVKTITAGRQRECEIYPIFSRRSFVRGKNYAPTKESVEKYNKKQAQKRLIRLLNANFTAADVWGTFTYDAAHLPTDLIGAKKFMQRYLRRLEYWMKKHGCGPLKYIYVTEHIDDGKKVRIHHHIVMNFPDRDLAEKKWGGGARTQVRRLQPDEKGLEGLARYITKSRTVKYEKMWASSKNLKKPKVSISDTAITRRKAERIVRSYDDATAIIEKMNPNYRMTELHVSTSEFINGAYIHAKMFYKGDEKG